MADSYVMPNVSAGMFQNRTQPNGPSPWSSDFSGNLNDILAPYQRIAQQISSPYATMRPNSWLARNHPQLAGYLDNAFLSVGMTPPSTGPEGAGEGAARMMQGLIGGQQYNRQRMVQQAMLPYQMAMGQLQAADIASQISERRAMAPYYRARSDWYENRIMEGQRQRFLPGGTQTDDTGRVWHQRFDPVTGDLAYVDVNSGKTSRELGIEPKFTNAEKQARRSTVGGYEAEIEDMKSSTDPATQAEGMRRWHDHLQAIGAMAGARATAVQNVTQPPRDLRTFIEGERRAAYGSVLPKEMNATEFQTSMIDAAAAQDPAAQKAAMDYWKNPQAAYEKYVKIRQGQRQQLDVQLSKYEKSSAPRQGVSFSEYQQNPSEYDGSAPNLAPTGSAPAAPSNELNYDTQGNIIPATSKP